MRCKNVLDCLDDHVDGILPAARSEAIRAHLDGCRECRETAFATRAASASLASWNDAEPPADCFGKILSRLEALPLEAFERPVAVKPRNRLAKLLPFTESMTSERVRFMGTSGLAAAAAVLAAVLVSQTDPRPVRRVHADRVAVPAVTAGASWFDDASFDDGLRYHGPGGPAMQPVRAAPRYLELTGTPR